MFRSFRHKKLRNTHSLYFALLSWTIIADLAICKPFETLQIGETSASLISTETNARLPRSVADMDSLVDDWLVNEGRGPEQRYRRDLDAKLTDIDIRVSVMKRSTKRWEPWQLNRDICPPSLCSSSDESVARPRPRGTGGTIFYNGDIVLDKESEAIIYGNELRSRWRRRKRATMRSSRLWRKGIVPYTMAENILPNSKKVVLRAMKNIEKHTCIRFRKRKSNDEDYVRFISEPGCWSNVGRQGGEQRVSIGRGCERLGIAIHEISHALGFWHEQARPDRDKYIRVIKQNISPRYLPDFEKANKTLVSSRGFPYDYESVMHYSKKAFTNLGEDTIRVIGVGRKLKMKIGQRDALSNIDIAQLRDMYKCNDKEDKNQTYCPDGWRKWGRSCYKFESEAREQFAGALRVCEGLKSRLLSIDDRKEDHYIKKMIRKKFPEVKAWRTGGRFVNGTFVWYQGDGRTHKKMSYTKWIKGHPASHSSMALVQLKPGGKVTWNGVWLGSVSQMPEHAYAVICERRARRNCIKGTYPDGRDYRGTLAHTVEGITCQKWSSQYPHNHNLLPYPYNSTDGGKGDKDGLGDHNYCRNPSGNRRSRPWCFTTKDKFTWQYCDVIICSGSSPKNSEDTIKSGKPTLRELNPGGTSGEKRQAEKEGNKKSNRNRENQKSSDRNKYSDRQNGNGDRKKNLYKNNSSRNAGMKTPKTNKNKDQGTNSKTNRSANKSDKDSKTTNQENNKKENTRKGSKSSKTNKLNDNKDNKPQRRG